MFTGIVEIIGSKHHILSFPLFLSPTHQHSTAVSALEPLDTSESGGGGTSLTIADAGEILEDAHLGDSIAVNGTCLTITELLDATHFKVGIAPETLRRTNLGALAQHSRVNLERALLPSTRLGGHFLQGHVDTVASIARKTADGNAVTLRLAPREPRHLRYVVEKGFVALDGASLTVTAVDDDQGWFEVMLIAYTQERIVTAGKEVGDGVNIEVDMVGKYVEKSVAGYFEGAQGSGGNAALERMVARMVDERLAGRKGESIATRNLKVEIVLSQFLRETTNLTSTTPVICSLLPFDQSIVSPYNVVFIVAVLFRYCSSLKTALPLDYCSIVKDQPRDRKLESAQLKINKDPARRKDADRPLWTRHYPLTPTMITTSVNLYDKFTEHGSADRVATDITVLDIIRQAYPDCYIRHINSTTCDLTGFAKAGFATADLVTEGDEYIAQHVYQPPKRRLEASLGQLDTNVSFGKYYYRYAVDNSVTFPVHKIEWFTPNVGNHSFFYIPIPREDTSLTSDFIDQLFLEAGKWTSELHEEIYVFDSGRWTKNKELHVSIMSASWDDVVVDTSTKEDLISDVEGFFDNRAIYAEYNIPWKRGIIFHGPPGNGKTISIKAIMASLGSRAEPIPSLYVKSMAANQGREYAVRAIFQQARVAAPCLLVFEDLDSLVTEKVRSYFLNEIDGLEANDGILMIGSTNHLNKLDPAIAKRPSRFDRKYFFNSPALAERQAYAQYWGRKLSRNKNMEWDDSIGEAVGLLTEGFSYAYLKELFMTTLFVLASGRMRRRGAAATDESDTATKDAGSLSVAALPLHLAEKNLVQIMTRHIATLREEMNSANESEKKEAPTSATIQVVKQAGV
ncbi:hypothetical protein FH972_021829 [Carpinus fangiana]|uniref:Riboflavin synthase n=1 Tax=Carpinus fangiana TaxID=176857 RepID=A0A5N6KQH1_9ROSI|nr:hypothetical protein FH972_021829 [Carpinus fangiana]